MTFTDALRAMAEGKQVQRHDGVVLAIQPHTVPILTTGLIDSPTPAIQEIKNNWILCRFPVIARVPAELHSLFAIGAPYAFSDEAVAAEDWEIAT